MAPSTVLWCIKASNIQNTRVQTGPKRRSSSAHSGKRSQNLCDVATSACTMPSRPGTQLRAAPLASMLVGVPAKPCANALVDRKSSMAV